MKKVKALLICLTVLSISVLGCGGSPDPTFSQQTEEKDETNEVVSIPESKSNPVSFENDVLTINDAVIKITDVVVTPSDGDFGDNRPILSILYDFTNTSGEPLEPYIAWTACFSCTQETDVTIEDLDAAPDPEAYSSESEMSFTHVKDGATVQSVMSYYINYTDRPVTLTARQGVFGDVLGEKIISFE